MEKWTIWKGWHFSLSHILERFIPRIGTGPVTYDFKFPKENWFPYVDKDDLDISKLAGFSYGCHHKDSIRIGWTPDFHKEGYFILYFYIYNNGVRKMIKFTGIRALVDYSLTISLLPEINYVTFDMTNNCGFSPVKASEMFVVPKTKIGYFLWFYFGGNKTAPKDMMVWLKRKLAK